MPRDTKFGSVVLENPHGVQDDEPVFVLCAHDSFALAIIQMYAHRCAVDIDRMLKVNESLEIFKEWQLENPDKVKEPINA